MFNYSYHGITLTVILDTRRAKKDGQFPVRYRVIYQRTVEYYRTGITLSEEDWTSLPGTRKSTLIEARNKFKAGFDRIEILIEDLLKGAGFSFDALNKRLSRGTTDNIFIAYELKIKALIANGQIGTSDWYHYSMVSIKKYTSKDLKFSDITIDWLNHYEKWLLENGKTYTTISMHIRALQSIVNEAKEQGIITPNQYPFGKGKYDIPTGTGRKLALTLAQIGKVMSYTLLSDTDKRCRDMWFFSYMCNGVNMNDLLRLRYSDIVHGEIRFYRQKTIHKTKLKKEIAAPLLDPMKQIINHWGNPDKKPESFIFPFLSDSLTPIDEKRIIKNVTRLINKKMNSLGEALEFGPISTYTARHSFATVLKRSGANIAFISESLGHTDLKTTENYLAGFEKEERLKNANLLTNF